MLNGRLQETRLESRCLEGNVLRDPSTRDVIVYLPPGYDGEKRFPLVLMLPAFAATHRSALGFDPWKPNTIETLDAQITRGECPPIVLALPDCMTRWGGSQYLDSPATGRYQTYLADEVIPHLDATFRTIPDRAARGVVGRSSGGFGALRLGMDRPDVVSVIASHAGDASFDVSMRPMLTRAAIAIDRAGGLQSFAERVATEGPKGSFDFDAVCVLASSAAYAPIDGPPPHCELPFDTRTAAINASWERWLAHDPVVRAPSSADALRQMKGIFLDAGETDEHGLQFAARSLAEVLRHAGATVEHEEHPGGHRGTSWRYGVSLPKVARLLSH